MYRGVVLVYVVVAVSAPPPLRLTIDCGSHEKNPIRNIFKSKSSESFDVNSFCRLIKNAIPKAVKDGKFVLIGEPDQAGTKRAQTRFRKPDQTGFSNDLAPVSILPPKGFKRKFHPKIRMPRIKVPNLNVPRLLPLDRRLSAPRVTMKVPNMRSSGEEESSAERMEKFKKGVQKMLHVVKVLGQIDQYLSERTRIIVDKLSSVFAE